VGGASFSLVCNSTNRHFQISLLCNFGVFGFSVFVKFEPSILLRSAENKKYSHHSNLVLQCSSNGQKQAVWLSKSLKHGA
jgi:hypothetical protein